VLPSADSAGVEGVPYHQLEIAENIGADIEQRESGDKVKKEKKKKKKT